MCVHVTTRCANCHGNHQANSIQCPSRQKAEMQARKNKAAKNPEYVEGDNPETNNQDMDKCKDWVRSLTGEPASPTSPLSRYEENECQDSAKDGINVSNTTKLR